MRTVAEHPPLDQLPASAGEELDELRRATRASTVLTDNAKHVLHALFDFAGQEGAPVRVAFTTERELAAAIGKEIATASRKLDELEELGLVRRDRIYPKQWVPGTNIRAESGTSVVKIDFDKVRELCPQAPARSTGLRAVDRQVADDIREEIRAEMETEVARVRAEIEQRHEAQIKDLEERFRTLQALVEKGAGETRIIGIM